MGCDIHGYVEIKYKGKWHAAGMLNLQRSYRLFCKIAKCGRNGSYPEIDTIAPNRGFPDDASEVTRLYYEDYWGPDAHNATWLTAEEMKIIDKWYRENGLIGGSGWDDPWPSCIDSDTSTEVTDHRVVIWFDN